MYVYVGSDKAFDFKAMSCPFYVDESKAALWNSLAVIDTGVVVAVAGIGGKIKMVKGYAKRELEVAHATPGVDGVFYKTEGYVTQDSKQLMLGGETGTYTYADFAFDDDNFYIYCRVYDKKKVEDETNADCVSIALDLGGGCYNKPQTTSYKFVVTPSLSLATYVGNGTGWVEKENGSLEMKNRITNSFYAVEMAIPWNELGVNGPVYGNEMSLYLEVNNSDGTNVKTEKIPDTKPLEPWTWMPLHLPSPTGVKGVKETTSTDGAVYDLSGRRIAKAGRGLCIKDNKVVLESK